jgi:hypothetical protein
MCEFFTIPRAIRWPATRLSERAELISFASTMCCTDNGRAEVEFENGAMALINENSVFEFFDLSSDDGSPQLGSFFVKAPVLRGTRHARLFQRHWRGLLR